MRQRPISRNRGFTLVELMVTIAIAAILMSIAVPSFRDMTIRNRLSTYTNDLITSVNIARSEAVKRGLPVSICSSDDQDTCSGDWSDGWIVFVNTDGDSPASRADDDTEPLIKVYGALDANYSLVPDDTFENDISYRRDGSATGTGMFALCYSGRTAGARGVIITPLRPRVAKDTNGDLIPNRDDTQNIAGCDAPSGS